ncbi:MAG: MMPL family transporter [Bacteroidetes bacterium]|nr:MMPL family transporter [Bacteroidota bacterium]
MKNLNKHLKEKSNEFGERWGLGIVKYRWLVLIGSLLLFFAAVSGGMMGFNSDYHAFFSDDNPQLIAFEELQSIYTKDDNVFILINRKDGKDIFDKKTLSAVEKLTEKAWQTPYSSRVDAITNFQYTRAVADDLYVDDLISDAHVKSAEELAELKLIATTDSRLVKRLINKDATATGINITIRLPDVQTFENVEIAAFVREMVEEFEVENPELETHLSGMVMLNNAFMEASGNDAAKLTPLMLLIVIITILLTTRTITGTFASLLVIIASIGSTMGIGAYIGMALTPPSAAFMNIVLTLAVADSIHILITLIQGMRTGLSKRDAVVESLRVNFMPIFITSLTTVIGFLSMNFGDSPAFSDLGNLTAIGLTAAFIFSVTLLPAVLTILPVRVKEVREESKTKVPMLDRLADFVIVNKRAVIIGCSLFIIGTSLLALKNELNDDFVKYLSKNISFRNDTDYISENLTGIYTLEFSVNAGEDGGISDPKYLHKLKEFEKFLYSYPEIIHVNAFTDVMRHLNKSMHGDQKEYFKIPESREQAAQFLLLYEMSLPFGLDLNNQVNVDKSGTRVIATMDNIKTGKMIEISEAASAWLKKNAPEHMYTEGTSNAMMFAHLTKRQITGMIFGTLLAMALIAIVLGVALKSFKYGALSLIPNITPVLAGLGIWGLFYGFVNAGIAMVFGMTLGIVVDDTVHFLSKYLRARREHGLSAEDSVRYAFTTVGKAMVVTSFVLVAGFMVMAQSDFGINSDMSKITVFIIVLAIILDFLLLPALLISGTSSKSNAPHSEIGINQDSPKVELPTA